MTSARYLEPHKLISTKHLLPPFAEVRIDKHHLDRVEKLWGGKHLLHGRDPSANAIHLSSNDYLCLVGQPELVGAQSKAIQQHESHELLMSAIFLHGDNPQGRLEKKFAEFLGAQDSIICQSGWSANVGLIQSLASPDVPSYFDMLSHASLWEGAIAANSRAIPFVHNDVSHLEKQIKKHGPGVIAVDSVYSTNGSLCPIKDILELAENTGSILVVDESHSLGTHGPEGAGLVAELGLNDRVHFRTASLAKCFAGRAGIITCPDRFKDYFMMEARQAVFSSGLLQHELAWFDAAIDFVQQIDHRRARLREISRIIRSNLSNLGYNVSDGSEQIIALEAGSEPQTMILRDALEENGIFGSPFCAPATTKNRSLMRFTMNSGITYVEVERIIKVCAKIRDQVKMQDWASTHRLHRQQAA